MEDEFKDKLKDDVANQSDDIEVQMEAAAAQFEAELNDANNGNSSPIIDLKSSKEKEAALREEIKRALKDKIGDHPEIDEKEKTKVEAESETEEKEERSPEVESVEKDDGDELIVDAAGKSNVKFPKGYISKLEKLHNMKMGMYRSQVEKHEINPDKELFYQTIKGEKYLLSLRTKYSDEERKIFEEYEDKFKQEEMTEQKKVRDELKLKTIDFDKLVTELKNINDEIAYVQKMQLNSTDREKGQITEEDAKKRLLKADERKARVLAEISILNPQLLIEERDEKAKMNKERINMVGYENISKQADELSDATMKNERYAENQEGKINYNLGMNNDYYQNEFLRRKQENEYQLYKLKKQLEELPENPVTADDISKKANILAEMQEVNNQIKIGNQMEKQLNSNMDKNIDDVAAFVSSGKEYEKEYEETENNFKETDEYVELLEKQEAEPIIDTPVNDEEEKEIEEFAAGATAGMAVAEAASGNIPAAVGSACISASLVRDVNNKEDAEAYLKVVDKSDSMKRERQQAEVELKAAEEKATEI